MWRMIAIMVLGTGILSTNSNAAAGQPGGKIPRLVKDDPPAVIVYDISGRAGPEAGRKFEFYKVKVAAWEDGRVVWSSRLPEAGYPYYEDRIAPDRISEILMRADKVTSGARTHSYLIPDASSRTIVVRETSVTAGLDMSSCHTWFADNPKVRIKSTGISVDDGTQSSAPMTEKERTHQEFMREFDEMERAALTLVPEDSKTSRTARDLKFNLPRKME